MTQQLVFGSPEANRIAAEIKFLETVECCPNCGSVAEMDRYAGYPGMEDEYGAPLPAGIYYRFRCPDHHLFGGWRNDRNDARLSWSTAIEIWWEINGERLNLDPTEEEAAQ